MSDIVENKTIGKVVGVNGNMVTIEVTESTVADDFFI